MTEPRPTISQLIENARQHVDNLADALPKVLQENDGAPIKVIVESLQGDLDAIERTLSDVHCDLKTQLDRI